MLLRASAAAAAVAAARRLSAAFVDAVRTAHTRQEVNLDGGSANWIVQPDDEHALTAMRIDRVLDKRRTSVGQDLVLFESGSFGKVLVLDSAVQSCTADEAVFHEALVQPACLSLALAGRMPRSALILGGGEGATARELLRWRDMQRVVMVDMDGEVIDVCRRLAPEWEQGAFADPRLAVHTEDARDFVARAVRQPTGARAAFDVIIMDLTDPQDGGPAAALFAGAFLAQLSLLLSPDGVLAAHGGPVLWHAASLTAALRQTLTSVFPHVRLYATSVPSFRCSWSLFLASHAADPWSAQHATACVQFADAMLDSAAVLRAPLRVHSGASIAAMFALDKRVLQLCAMRQPARAAQPHREP